MKITDTVQLGDLALSDDGYLETNALTARAGIQVYAGSELGRPDLGLVNVYRPEDEVFSKDSLHTYSRLPITNDHPPESVTADNWKKYAVGTTGDDVLRDGEYMKLGLKIADRDAVADVRAGKRELSAGYSCDLIWEDGIAPCGTPYKARQTNIRANHMAVVKRGRAGSRARLGDSWAGMSADHIQPQKVKNMKTVIIDGIPHEVEAKSAPLVEALQRRVADSAQALEKETAKVDALDVQLAAKDAEIDSLRASQMNDAELDARVTERADLISKARAVVDADYTGMSAAAIRHSVVLAKVGDAALQGKGEAYIDARFEILCEDAMKDPVRREMSTHTHTRDSRNTQPRQGFINDSRRMADTGQSAYEERLRNAHKQGVAK